MLPRASLQTTLAWRVGMITERLTFKAKYGHGDELVALFKESIANLFPTEGVRGVRVYTDATGPMFSVVTEMDYDDATSWSRLTAGDPAVYGTSAFQEWFAKMMAVTESGERQLLNMEVIR
jgi:hypothetical protein